ERDERGARRVEMPLAFGEYRVLSQRLRIDREAPRRVEQRLLGDVHVVFLQKRAAVQQQDRARSGGQRRHAFERLARLAQIYALVLVAGTIEPRFSEGAIEERLAR